MKKITVVIPNFNGAELLKENLPYVVNAIKISNKSKKLLSDLIIVDDSSTDDSVEVIKIFQRKHDSIQFIINKKNLGFAKSVHRGIEESEADFIILLNTDVIIPEDFILKIVEPFEDNKVFAVSPVITDNNKGILSGSYKVPFLKRGEIKFKKWKHLDFKREKLLKTFFSEGGSVALDRKKYFKIGGFDDIYEPFYFEDTDLCIKAWKKGWISYFLTDLKVIHNHKSTISKFYSKNFIKKIMRRNRFIFLWSNLPKNYLISVHIPFIIQRLIFNTLKLDFSYLTGLFSALKFINKIKLKRKKEGSKNFFDIIDEINKDFENLSK